MLLCVMAEVGTMHDRFEKAGTSCRGLCVAVQEIMTGWDTPHLSVRQVQCLLNQRSFPADLDVYAMTMWALKALRMTCGRCIRK